jgi:hypothetical protein
MLYTLGELLHMWAHKHEPKKYTFHQLSRRDDPVGSNEVVGRRRI